MSGKELVSVIVPVYNVEEYLPRGLDSIAAQTYRDIEVILVDDGSTDTSGSICDDYCLKDSRFRVIHQENKWLAEARNTGIAAATGSFLMFVDSDDAIHPRMIERMLKVLRESGADFVMCGHRHVSPPSFSPFEEFDDEIRFEAIESKEFARRLLLEMGVDSPYGLSWNKLIPRELAGGMRFDDIYANEDVSYSLRLALRCAKVALVEDRLYDYTKRDTSIMHAPDALDKWRYNHTIMRARCLDYIPESETELRGCSLSKMYRRILSSRSSLKETKFEAEYNKLVDEIVAKTRKEFFGHPGISLREKIVFRLFWPLPSVARLFMRLLGN